MKPPNPQKYTVIIGSYLLVSLLIFSVFLLGWSYRSSILAIDKELKSSFSQRHLLCENILETRSEFIDFTLNTIISNISFLDEVFLENKENTQNILLNIHNSDTIHNIDLVFVSLANHKVWTDASSSLYNLKSILPDIAMTPGHNSKGMIRRFRNEDVDLTLLFKSVQIIHHRTGKVIGSLYGGVILNDHLSLLERVKYKTESSTVVFFDSGDLIGSTARYDSKVVATLKQARSKTQEQEIYNSNDIIASYKKIDLFGNSTSLEVAMAVPDESFIAIKRTYQAKTIILFFLSIIFFLTSIYIIRSLTYPSMEKLIIFSEEVTSGKTDARYTPGGIIELNKLGRSIEMMVAGLKAANQEIQKEIEERKRTEDILKTKDIHLKTIVRTMPDLIWMKDEKGRYLFCNSKFERFFNSKEQEIIGKTDYDFVDKNLADFFINQDRLAIEKGEPRINEEEVIYLDDGHKEILETIKTPIYGNDGKLIGVLGIARDITDRKENLDRFRTVMDSLDSLVYVADMQTYEILFINQYGKDICGEITGKTCWQTLQQGQKGPCAFCTNDQLLDSDLNPKEPVVWEFQNTANKEWYECRDQAVRWMDGRIVRMEIATNITQRKKAEEQKNILEEKLRQSHKMEAVGTLAGGIAHDFNNILGIIIGHTELALKKIPIQNDALRHMEKIKTAGLRAKDVTHQLLSFSRKTEQKKEPLRIIPIVKESIKLMRATMPTSIEIKVETDDDLTFIKADPTQIQQVIINLCTNAAHAMEKEGGLLKVRLTREIKDQQKRDLPSGSYLLLSVSDTGGGIPPEIQGKVFDPYFTTKKTGQGSGMGLAIVHGIVKSHDGHIILENQYKIGTTINVFFPICKETLLEQETEQDELLNGSETILFIDDEASIVDFNTEMLQELGYTVESEQDPVAALKLFKINHSSFDIVITDMTMPHMTGLEVMKQIRSIRPDIPVIICTGYSTLINNDEADKMKVDALLIKPVLRGTLAKTIRKVLSNKKINASE